MLSRGLRRGTGHAELSSCTHTVPAWNPFVRSILPKANNRKSATVSSVNYEGIARKQSTSHSAGGCS